MGRLITYLLITTGSLAFWFVELWINYFDYANRDPFSLKKKFQAAYVFQSDYLIAAELIFPLLMTIAFLAMLLFKFASRPIRLPLGFFLLLAAEFWTWRTFFFKDRMAVYYALNEAPENVFVNFKDFHFEYMLVSFIALAVVVFMRERADDRTIGAHIRDRRLRQSLENWRDRERS